MERREDVSSTISAYFKRHLTGTAKEIYNKTGRKFSHSSICNVLDEMKEAGDLDMRVAPATKYRRACYVFIRVNKKESLQERFCNFFKSLFNQRPHQ